MCAENHLSGARAEAGDWGGGEQRSRQETLVAETMAAAMEGREGARVWVLGEGGAKRVF